jgi:phosphoglycerol transferase MdoB-like AlkP superfamily enzyme
MARNRLLPILLGVLLTAGIVWAQFVLAFTAKGFYISIILGILFYFCYAWYERIAAADAKRSEAS